jgi:Domain of unknown function (DUF4388)
VASSEDQLQRALQDLREYLSDRRTPPGMADSLTVLLDAPQEVVAREIHAWASEAPGPSSLSDHLSSGIRRVLALGSLQPVPGDRLTAFVRRVGEGLLALAPPLDRNRLVALVSLLPRPAGAADSAVDASGAPFTPPTPNPGASHTSQRLTLILDRLDVLRHARTTKSRPELLLEAVLTAALEARSIARLEESLDGLRRRGFLRGTDEIFRALAETLPDWWVPGTVGTMPPALLAMARMVALAPDRVEGARRFRELVHAAIDEFNHGAVGRAARVFEMAEHMITAGEVDSHLAEALRVNGHEYLNLDRVRRLLEGQEWASFPEIVLRFFRVFTPETLLERLRKEPRRERRRLLMAFLETQGQAGRDAAFERLTRLPEDEHDFFLLRNLVHLLVTIPRPSDAAGDLERELGRVVRLLVPENPPFLVREVLVYLGQVRHRVAEQVLVLFLRTLEDALLTPSPDAWEEDRQRWLGYLDRTCVELARSGTPAALAALVEHGLRTDEVLGDCAVRLSPLAERDLGDSKHLVARLVAGIEAALPRGGFASLPAESVERLGHLVGALAGTRTPEVRKLFESLAARFPRHELGAKAERALVTQSSLRPATPLPAANLAGDLNLFGLPILLQKLADSNVTGTLSLLDERAETMATVVIEGGRILGARHAELAGADAVYQLLERPFAGTFAFSSRTATTSSPAGGQGVDVIPTLLEGMRRHDELRRASLLVPDDASLEATGRPPTAVPGENDLDFVSALWEMSSGGASPSSCEQTLHVDSYRVRRGVVYWLEEGALRLRRT